MPTQTTETATPTGASAHVRSKAPVFVLGCPRSGTTLLYHMLLSAGNFVVYRAESQVFNLLEPRFGDLRIARNRRRLLEAWENSSLFTKTGLDAKQVEEDVMACLAAANFTSARVDGAKLPSGHFPMGPTSAL